MKTCVKKLSHFFKVTQQTISECLKDIEIMQNQGNLVPHKLNRRDAEEGFFVKFFQIIPSAENN